MRRFAALLLSLVLLVTMAATGSAAADIRVLFDEQEVQFDAKPFIEDGRTLVPVRALAERLGFTVGWNEGEQKITLTKGESTILLWIGSTKVVVNGKEGTVDVPPTKVNNRTFVPVRFVAERMGALVVWDDKQNTAVVSSGESLFAKLSQQRKPLDQKLTGDFVMQMDLVTPGQSTAGSVSIKVPVHMDAHMYHNDMLMTMTMQVPAMGQSTPAAQTIQMALKDGQMYMQDPVSQQWKTLSGSTGSASGTVVTDVSAALKQSGFGDFMQLQADFAQQAVVAVGGVEAVDGVQTVRLDVDLSKVKFGSLFDKIMAGMPVTGGVKPDIKLNVDRYTAHYWFNPETQFLQKMVLDASLVMDIRNAGQTMAFKLDIKGEVHGKAVSEPIKFPDFNAPAFTAEQKAAAQTYWDGLNKNVPMQPCIKAAKDADAHWADKSFTAGSTASVSAAGCFIQQRMALAELKQPADFAEAHKALSLSFESMEKAYAGFGQAFDLAAKGDIAASDAKKADATKVLKAGQQSLAQAVVKLVQLQIKYGLK